MDTYTTWIEVAGVMVRNAYTGQVLRCIGMVERDDGRWLAVGADGGDWLMWRLLECEPADAVIGGVA